MRQRCGILRCITCKILPICKSWCIQVITQKFKEVKFSHSPKNTAPVGGNAGRLLSFTIVLLRPYALIQQGKLFSFYFFLGNKNWTQQIICQLNLPYDFLTPEKQLALQMVRSHICPDYCWIQKCNYTVQYDKLGVNS